MEIETQSTKRERGGVRGRETIPTPLPLLSCSFMEKTEAMRVGVFL